MKYIKKFIYSQVASGNLKKEEAKVLLSEIDAYEVASKNIDKDVAIIGISCRLPNAENVNEYWNVLQNGISCINSFPQNRRKDTDILLNQQLDGHDPYRHGGYLDRIDKFDPSIFRISPKEAEFMDPNQRLFLETAWEAIEDAGLGGNKLSGTRTGVYVGKDTTYDSEYAKLVNNSEPLMLTGSVASILASRLSYILDLKGPSVLVDTACSSSLVALHMASHDIRNGKIEMAIVGGINLFLMPVQVGVVDSEDGVMRAFDKNSSGTVWGEGVGAVIIKSIKDAIRDRNNIYAVIKGSAVNNDGTSNGLTAPNAEAQADVIQQAWKDASIDPATISYIEAHGTGTKIGDPIEVKGITLAFKKYTSMKQFCGIGSVKTNIGHTVGASGMASIIKAVLSLKNKKIPPNLNIKEPNPFIDFMDSPVYLNDKLQEWNCQDKPRRCGINSFGFSGTNCHIVLEEAPADIIGEKIGSLNKHIFTLSAKTEWSMKSLINRYKVFLESAEHLDLGDICFTANTGRNHYNFRLALLVNDRYDLARKINSIAEINLEDIQQNIDGAYYANHKIVFNKDSKKIGELPEEEKLKISFSINSEINEAVNNKDISQELLKKVCDLYITGVDINFQRLYSLDKYKILSLPTYPFDSRRFWVEVDDSQRNVNGKNNFEKCIDHPLLDRCLVKTMNEGIFLTEFDVDKQWILREHVITDNSVIPGTAHLEMAIRAAKEYFKQDVTCLQNIQFLTPVVVNKGEIKKVQTVIKELGDKIQFTTMSCLENTNDNEWLTHATGEIVLDPIESEPKYNISELAKQCDEDIKFDKELFWKRNTLMEFGTRWKCIQNVKLGKRQALTHIELAPELESDVLDFTLHPSLLDVATAVVGSVIISKGEFYLPLSYKKILIYKNIPSKCYSYISKITDEKDNREIFKYDVTILDIDGNVVAHIYDFTLKKVRNIEKTIRDLSEKDNLFYNLRWVTTKLEHLSDENFKNHYLIIKSESEISEGLARKLSEQGNQVISIEMGIQNRKIDDNHFIIEGTEAGYSQLFREIKNRKISSILHLSSIKSKNEIENLDELELRLQRGVYDLFHLVKGLENSKLSNEIEIVLISNYVNEITGKEEELNPENATLFGLGKVIGEECTNIRCRCIDIDQWTTDVDISNELNVKGSAYQIAYRNGERYSEIIEEIKAADIVDKEIEIKEDGVYIITGGTGGIGLEICKSLASEKRVNLALINRSKFPSRGEWEELLKSQEGTKLCKKIRALMEIESMGARVVCHSADVTNPEEIESLIKGLRAKFGRINGVIHSAGLPGDGFIIRKSEKVFREVLAPKVVGTWLLNKTTEEDKLDFFVMFSSVATLFGGSGQGDYTAANSYMDSFSAYRNRLCGRTLTINWPAWKETGMAVDFGVNKDLLFNALGTADAIQGFKKIFNSEITKAVIGEINFSSGIFLNQDSMPIQISDEIKTKIDNKRKKLKYHSKDVAGKHTENILIKGKEHNDYTEIERKLAFIWAESLGLSEINIYDDFYSMGGDSILAIRITNAINNFSHKKINISDLFDYLTIDKLAMHLDEQYVGENKDFDLAEENAKEDKSVYDLSSTQKRIWFLQQYDPSMTAYNLPAIYNINSKVDIEKFNESLNILIARHESLRSVFLSQKGIPKQLILNKIDLKAEVVDLTSEIDKQSILKEQIRKENQKVFDFSKSLVRVILYKLDEEEYCLYLNIHHIITDGWSMDIVTRELMEIYKGITEGIKIELGSLNIRYVEWIDKQKAWMLSKESKDMELYWMKELSKPLPALNLPLDFNRPQLQTFRGSYIKMIIDREHTSNLKELAKKANTTLHMLFLSAYFTFLHKITHDEDIIVGFPIAGRDDKDIENVIGLFMNTLCIRVDFSILKQFKDLVNVVKSKSLQAYKRGKYPFDLLVNKVNPERDLSRSTIFSTMFQFFENIPQQNDGISQYELSLLCREIGDQIEARIEYNLDIFRKETIECFAGYYQNILWQICADPDIDIANIEVMSPKEKVQISSLFDNMGDGVQNSFTVHQLFEQQVRKSPDSIAIICEDEKLSYRELNNISNQLAHLLRKESVKTSEPIGLIMNKGINMIVGIIGILKAGGAYVPIDPHYPDARISYMLTHSQMRILLTEDSLTKKIEQLMINENNIKVIVDMGQYPEMERFAEKFYNINDIMKFSLEEPKPYSYSSDLMYIIYTSGSTGVPKGVMVSHSNAVNFMKWSIENAGLSKSDHMMLVTSISFDISVFEIFGALLSGATLSIIKDERLRDPEALLEYIEEKKVSIWHSVPTLMMQMLMFLRNNQHHDDVQRAVNMRRIMIGGEAWSVELAKEIRENFRYAEIVNMYGPTEATIWVTSYKIGSELNELKTIPIGKPIDNNSILILDNNMKLCGPGIAGDIYVKGANITSGYYRDEEMTKQVFITSKDGKTIYKTGDIGKYLTNGNVEYLGRKDGMVKVRGYRIEVGEIENVMLAHGAISQVAVITKKLGDTNKLICFYVSHSNQTVGELIDYLGQKLPEYMVPSQFIKIEHMLLTPNGKIDRKALAEMEVVYRPEINSEYVEPVSDTEKFLADIWCELLDVERVGINDNFFELGGNSMLVSQMYAEIENKYAGKVKIVDIFNYPTIAKLSKHINGNLIDQIQNTPEREDRNIEVRIEEVLDGIGKDDISIDDIIKNLEDMEV